MCACGGLSSLVSSGFNPSPQLKMLLLRRLRTTRHRHGHHVRIFKFPFASLSSPQSHSPTSDSIPKPGSLSARMSFVFDQIDAIEKERSEKDQTLQRIRAWRESKRQSSTSDTGASVSTVSVASSEPEQEAVSSVNTLESRKDENEGNLGLRHGKKEVELVHPWPEWIGLMERLVQQNYFDHRRKDEDGMLENLGFDSSEIVEEDGFDFTRDFKTVQTAVLNFGRDRFDILRSFIRLLHK